MKKILIVAYYFPPVAASGAMRPLAFCRFLESLGWSPRVLTTNPASVYPSPSMDRQLLTKIPSGVRVNAIPHGNPLQKLIAWRDQVRGIVRGAQEARSKKCGAVPVPTPGNQESRSGVLRAFKNFILDGGFAFPDPQCAWLKPVVAFAKQLPRAEVPEIVLATGGPWTSLLAGKRIADYWRVPFIADYRDPWTRNPYVSFPSSFLNAKARMLEESICKKACRVITNTHELRLQLQKDYPNISGKALTITNGFDPDSFSSHQESASTRRATETKLELCHFGTVYGKRTPVVLLQSLLELHQAGRLTGKQFCLRFVGAWDVTEPRCEELAQRLEKVGLLKREPPMPYQACLQQMNEADALLVIQPDSPLQIPGKIYEYIATRRPLLLIGGEGATANLVQRHCLGLACSNKGEEIRQLVLDIIEGRQKLPVPASQEIDRFNYRNITADLARVLDEVHQEILKETN